MIFLIRESTVIHHFKSSQGSNDQFTNWWVISYIILDEAVKNLFNNRLKITDSIHRHSPAATLSMNVQPQFTNLNSTSTIYSESRNIAAQFQVFLVLVSFRRLFHVRHRCRHLLWSWLILMRRHVAGNLSKKIPVNSKLRTVPASGESEHLNSSKGFKPLGRFYFPNLFHPSGFRLFASCSIASKIQKEIYRKIDGNAAHNYFYFKYHSCWRKWTFNLPATGEVFHGRKQQKDRATYFEVNISFPSEKPPKSKMWTFAVDLRLSAIVRWDFGKQRNEADIRRLRKHRHRFREWGFFKHIGRTFPRIGFWNPTEWKVRRQLYWTNFHLMFIFLRLFLDLKS